MVTATADRHNERGRRLLDDGRPAEALACFAAATREEPGFAEAHFNCSLAYRRLGNPAAALDCLERALEARPDFHLAHFTAGNLLFDAGDLDRAAAAYRACLALDPGFAAAHYNLGKALLAAGRRAEAAGCFERAIAIDPGFAEALNDLGLIHKEAGRLTEAVRCYQRALAARPGMKEALLNLGVAGLLEGDVEAARACFRRALAVDPHYAPARWLHDFSLPVIYAAPEEIVAHRRRFAAHLERLARELSLATEPDRRRALAGIGSTTHFYLGYQGENDCALQRTYGELVCRVMAANYPEWARPCPMPPRPPGGRIRIGYLSSFMRTHTVGHFLLGWLEAHRRERCELFGYHIGEATDRTTARIQNRLDLFRQVGGRLEAAAEAIRGDRLHVLIYTDIGMNALATQLGGLRLAPLQCKGWGHPVTTGLPTIDCYLSSDLMEPDDAAAHYTERLVRLPNLALNLSPPPLPRSPAPRQAFGLEAEAVVYLSSQSLFKYLPQHDDLYPRIALEVPAARFVFIADRHAGVTRRFGARLERAFRRFGLDAGRHVVIQPRLDFEAFLSLNLRSDLLLDTLEWSGGKTTFEAIACGLPVVTLPGRFMRGRHAYAMLTMMGVRETIAADKEGYIGIAIALGRDADRRSHLRARMTANRSRLYGDTTFMQALEDFLAAEVAGRTESR